MEFGSIEQVRAFATELGQQIIVWLAPIGGITGLLTLVIKMISSRMSKKDVKRIAQEVVTELENSEQKTIELDISSQVDKATNNRLAEVENKTNCFIEIVRKLASGQSKIMTTLADFTTPSIEHKQALLQAVSEFECDVEPIKVESKPVLIKEPTKSKFKC